MSDTVPDSAPRPASDVSAGVGFAGLAGLLGWIAFCRSYPALADQFGWAGPHQPLSGPLAALSALLFSSLPMIAWSLLVDKVHRRPSTGIDWALARPMPQRLPVSLVKLVGLWATWAIIAGLYCLARWYWNGNYLFAIEVLATALVPLVALSIPYVLWLDGKLTEPRDHAWHFGAFLLRRDGWHCEEIKRHWRAWIIKGFFTAFMISILPHGFAAVVNADFAAIADDPIRLGLALFELLFVIDVQIGTVGYLLTLRPLDAHIRSGNPFLAGWVAALMCYPPFVFAFMGGQGALGGQYGVLAYEVNAPGWGHWLAGIPALAWAWMIVLVVLTAIYAWATVAFGIRFSNLTYRGVITNGPYRLTRHPAYVSKNLFWWLSVLPFLTTSGSIVDIVRNTVFLGCVSGIYYWRARTEEAHLLGEDAKYRAYHAWAASHAPITRALGSVAALLRRW